MASTDLHISVIIKTIEEKIKELGGFVGPEMPEQDKRSKPIYGYEQDKMIRDRRAERVQRFTIIKNKAKEDYEKLGNLESNSQGSGN